jgi:hypothetical protein
MEQTIDAHRTGGRQEQQAHAEQEKHHRLHAAKLGGPPSAVKGVQGRLLDGGLNGGLR